MGDGLGDPGSSPNELLALSVTGGFTSLVISGAPGGGSFVLDDLSFSNTAAAVPLPGTLLLVLLGMILLAWRRQQSTVGGIPAPHDA